MVVMVFFWYHLSSGQLVNLYKNSKTIHTVSQGKYSSENLSREIISDMQRLCKNVHHSVIYKSEKLKKSPVIGIS